MSSDIFSRIAGKKTIKKVAQVAVENIPIVRTVQAGQAFLKVGEAIHNVDGAAANLNDFIPKASNAIDRVDKFIPSMQVIGQSFCDSVKIFNTFNIIATSAGIAANLVLTYQGVQALQLIAARLKDISTSLAAQTALIAQRDFPQYVYDMIRERVGQTSDDPDCNHWFFLFHPDNDWYPKFYRLLEAEPLGPAFCGYTNQIDTVFSFMLAARRRIDREEQRARDRGRPVRPVRLHLLIPAYQTILITDALKIPEELGDFVMEGRIHSNNEFVWLNLPAEQSRYVVGIGRWVPPTPGWWESTMSMFGLAGNPPMSMKPRVLGIEGIEKRPPEDDDEQEDKVSEPGHDKQEGESNRHNATPLHNRSRRRHKRRDRENHSEVK